MADREARRMSFGSVAADYDRYRPAPPPQALDWLIPPGAQAEFNALARESREADRPQGQRRRREVTFPPGTPLSPPEERRVEFSLPLTSEQLAGLLGTYSGVITLGPEQRAEFSRRSGPSSTASPGTGSTCR